LLGNPIHSCIQKYLASLTGDRSRPAKPGSAAASRR
jgi:hypothetical protein